MIYEGDLDLAPVVGVDRAWSIDDGDAVVNRES